MERSIPSVEQTSHQAAGPLPGADGARAALRFSNREADHRYERKYFLNGVSHREVKLLLDLHPKLFRESFPPRFVNNIYLDSLGLGCYHANLAGVSPRQKYRIRWYGALHQKSAAPVLEIKRKVNLAGDKIRVPLGQWDTSLPITDRAIAHLIERTDGERCVLGQFRDLRCILANRYRRSYFESSDGLFRITIDRAIQFFPFRYARLIVGKVVNEPGVVVEIKYPTSLDIMGEEVARRFPFRISRISKYVRGVEVLRGNFLF